MFIWGYKGYSHHVGYIIRKCPSCGKTGPFSVIRTWKKFTPYFIPTFSYSNKQYLECGLCRAGFEISGEIRPDVLSQEQLSNLIASIKRDIKKCPFCAEEIKADAKYCRFCHHDLFAQPDYGTDSRPVAYPYLENDKGKRGEEDVLNGDVIDIPQENNLQKKSLTSSLEYMDKKEYDEALKAINQFIGSDPGNAESYNIRGIVQQKLKNYYDALQDFQKAIELDPKDSRSYFNRALLNKELGERQSMIRFMVAAAKLGHKEAQDFLKLEGISW